MISLMTFFQRLGYHNPHSGFVVHHLHVRVIVFLLLILMKHFFNYMHTNINASQKMETTQLLFICPLKHTWDVSIFRLALKLVYKYLCGYMFSVLLVYI